MLLLKLLADQPMYGYQIIQELKRRSGGYFDMKEGLIYPTLHRMQREGLLTSEKRTAQGRSRKYYMITPTGHELLGNGSAEWETFMQQMQAMLDFEGGAG